MAELMTSITPKDGEHGDGIADWGRQSRAHMIEQIRRHADHMRAQVERIDATDDDEFLVEQYRGVIVQRDKITIEPGEG